MSMHTPGPWQWYGDELLSSNRFVLSCARNGRPDRGDKDLIAAAPDLLTLAKQYASECGECNGTGLVSFKTWPGGIEVDNDDQPCGECAYIRAAIAKATQP